MTRINLPVVRSRNSIRKHPRRASLTIEQLEQRQLLATVTLNTDLGIAGELRTAIAGAVAGETIDFALGAGNESIVLTQGPLVINKNLTLDGANTAGSGTAVTVNGNAQSRVLDVDNGDGTINTLSATLRNITITGGNAVQGGGISNAEILSLQNVTVRNNFAQQPSAGLSTFGGGILNSGRLTLSDSRVQDNIAQFAPNGANSAFGGGIASSGMGAELTILNSTVSGNETIGGTGGGIFTRLSSLTIDNSNIDDNRTGLDLGVLSVQRYDAGGGIAVFSEGPSATFAPVDVTITNSSISGNVLNSDSFTALVFPYGGGFYVRGRGNVEISNTTISGNVATGSNAAGPNVISRGGGMFIYGDDGGDLIVNIRHSTIDGNNSFAQGGAIAVRGRMTNNGNPLDDGPVHFRIENSTISNNSSGTQGGAVWNWSHNASAPDITNLHIINSSVTGNSAGGRSGAFHNRSGANLFIENSTISGNSSATNGGAITNMGYGLSSGQQATKSFIRNSTLSGNSADANGGAIYSYDATLELFQSTISGNSATTGIGGGLYLRTASSYVGGPLEGFSSIERSTMTLNESAGGGGGIAVDYYHGSQWRNSIVSGNIGPVGAEDIDLGFNTSVSYAYTLIGGNAMLGPLVNNGGPTQTHLPATGSPVVNAADPTATGTSDQRGFAPRVVGSAMDMGSVEVGAGPSCDFNGDGNCGIGDIDLLITEIASGGTNLTFDLNGDGFINLGDRDAWLTAAGAANLPCGNPYTNADFNLDGLTDGTDFGIFNSFKFTSTGKWSQGDANADGVTDGSDFGIFNANKFTAACTLDRTIGEERGASLATRLGSFHYDLQRGKLHDDGYARNGSQFAAVALHEASGRQIVLASDQARGTGNHFVAAPDRVAVTLEPVAIHDANRFVNVPIQLAKATVETQERFAVRDSRVDPSDKDRDQVFADWLE